MPSKYTLGCEDHKEAHQKQTSGQVLLRCAGFVRLVDGRAAPLHRHVEHLYMRAILTCTVKTLLFSREVPAPPLSERVATLVELLTSTQIAC